MSTLFDWQSLFLERLETRFIWNLADTCLDSLSPDRNSARSAITFSARVFGLDAQRSDGALQWAAWLEVLFLVAVREDGHGQRRGRLLLLWQLRSREGLDVAL